MNTINKTSPDNNEFDPTNTLVVLYGSRSGNARKIAEQTHIYAGYCGLTSVLCDMQSLDYSVFSQIQNILLIVSTHGEGEPPYAAEEFYEWIHSPQAPLMEKCNYSVLALGDSSYKHYCKTGVEIDHRLDQLSGKRLKEVETCDLDFTTTAMEWIERVVSKFEKLLPVNISPDRGAFQFQLSINESGKTKGYLARVIEKKVLNPGSSKTTLHVRLNLKNSNLSYKPGDSVGLYCKNSRWLVDKLLKKLNLDPAQTIVVDDQPKLLKMILIDDYELTVVTSKVMRDYASVTGNTHLKELCDDKWFIRQYVESRDILDMVSDFPGSVSAGDLLNFLRKLPPRLYSAACSQRENEEAVEITVSVVNYKVDKRKYEGVCTDLLLNRIDRNNFLPIFIDSNPGFYLPDDGNTPIIMIATGTGIAPFRAFLQERRSDNAGGKNWLIFGDRNRSTDFLYEDEMKDHLESGLLSRLDTAFSRDQKEKYYVDQVVRENASEIKNWFDEGAILYICGNKRKMAVSVKESLAAVFQQVYGLDPEKANNHYISLKKSKQIREDVY